jgi:hypothetical protein
MKTKKITSVFLLLLLCLCSVQAITVSRNTVLFIGKQTQVKLTNTDLTNNGTLIGDTASLLAISTSRGNKISGNNFYLSSLKIDGNVSCDVQVLSILNDLIMESGVLNIGTNKLVIYGELLDEKENAHVTASTGTIEKHIEYLPARRQKSALGLEFTPINDVYDLRIIRSHNPIMRPTRTSTTRSATRVYDFSTPVDITAVQKRNLAHEIANMHKPTLFVHDFEDWQKVKNRNEEFFAVSQISTFSPDELHFPKVITPEAVANTKFEIIGLDEYPNSRLIILNKNGQQLYDLFPYKNDFDGRDLPDGTYYFVFSEERDSPPSKRSFFEIVR